MGLEKLEYLLTVEKTGSISKAADLLFMSQPSLSKSIASVERDIGCKLFQRTPNGLKPTTEGSRYLAYAHQAVKLREDVLADLRHCCRERPSERQLVLGLTPMRSTATLSKTLLNFANSGIPIILRSVITQDDALVEKLLASEVDIAVVTMPAGFHLDPTLACHHLCSERLLLTVSCRNPVLKKAKWDLKSDFPYLSPRDMQDQRFILPNPGTRLHEMLSSFFQAEGIYPRCSFYEDNIDIARASVARGLGVCFVNERLARAAPSEEVCYCRTEGTLPIRNVYALWRKADAEKPDMAILFRLFCQEWQEVHWHVDETESTG